MKDASAQPQSTAPTAIEAIGVVCARAAVVAIGVGMLEGTAIGRRIGMPTAGMGLATSGLWFPAALLMTLLVAGLLRVLRASIAAAAPSLVTRVRNAAWMAAAVLFFGALLFWMKDPAAEAAFGSPLHAAPLELVVVTTLSCAASLMRFEGQLRRIAAYAGLAVALFMQLYANRWMGEHLALAGALSDASFVPRVMLRWVLRRFA